MLGARLVIGVGNPDRGDDGVGRAAARTLRDRVDEGVEVREHQGEVATLLEWLEDAEAVVLIDAAASGGEPGTVHRLDAHAGPLPQTLFALSTHGFGVAEAVEFARAMNCLPPTCIIYAVEGQGFEAGAALSAPVQDALAVVTEKVLAELAD